jgi:hypothetical protein
VPFVFSHDVCGVPGYPGAAFATAQLELLQEPAGLLTWKTEPLVSLMTAVAATGAAVSPSMGRQTLPSARMLLAAINVRLGRWMPNPFSARIQRRVAALTNAGRLEWDPGMGPGYNELIPEMIGLSGKRVYVSDGGHYDNLGLIQLLRAKCAEIWCVDASPEPMGEAAELHRVLAQASEELGVRCDIDLDRFSVGPDGFYGATHSVGTVAYPDGTAARLTILKLGLTRDAPNDLRQRRRSDRGFPHHSTFLEQVYTPERMDAYRRLGYETATRGSRTATGLSE